MRNAKGNERIIDAKKCDYTPFLGVKKVRISLIYGVKKVRISLIYGAKKIIFVPLPLKDNHIQYEEIL